MVVRATGPVHASRTQAKTSVRSTELGFRLNDTVEDGLCFRFGRFVESAGAKAGDLSFEDSLISF